MKPRENRLVVLTPGFPADTEDLNCIPVIQSFVKYLAETHPEGKITVIAFQYPFREQNYTWHSVDVYSAGGSNRKGLYRFITWWKVWLRMHKLSKESKVLAIHSFWLTECSFVAAWFCRFRSINHIATIVGQDCLPANRYLPFVRNSNTIITALSVFGAEKYQDLGYKAVDAVIPIGFHPADFPEMTNNEKHYDILGVGNLHQIKNFSLFVELINKLQSVYKHLRCCLIGNGELYHELQEKVRACGLEEVIEMPGELNRKAVLQRMACSRILLHPSLHEGQGYIFEEALYCGMMVVAFKVGNLVPGERIYLAGNDEEMYLLLMKALGKPFPDSKFVLTDINESVQRYFELYSAKPTRT